MTVVAPERVVANGDPPKRRSKIVAILVMLVLGLGVWVVLERVAGYPVPEGWTRAASLDLVRGTGVVPRTLSVQHNDIVAEFKLFLVFDSSSDTVVALSAIDPHKQRVSFCQSSGWFEDPQHGSKFDRLGRYALGPAPRGLDRIAVLVLGDDVFVDAMQVITGPPRYQPKAMERTGPFCSYPRRLWN